MTNTLDLFTLCTKVLMPVYGPFILPSPPLIVQPSSCIPRPTRKWSPMNSRRAVTLAHARDKKSRPLLVPSSHRRSPGSLSQANIELYITSPTHIPLLLLHLLLMLPSTQIYSLARGEPLPRYVTLFITSLTDLRLPSTTLPKPTAP